MKLKLFAELLRLRQWIKNVFIFAALVFAERLFVPSAILRSLAAFIIFSLTSSSGYIVNDILDRKKDTMHPVKRLRPIAAGLVPLPNALVPATLLVALALPLAFLLQVNFGTLIAGYFALSLLYSLWLKHIPIVEFITVALFYVGRVWAGALAIEVPTSRYIVITTFFLALAIIIAKRLQEKKLSGDNTRAVLRLYPQGALAIAFFIVSTGAIGVYLAWVLWLVNVRGFDFVPLLGISVALAALGIAKFFTLMTHSTRYQDLEAVIWNPTLLVIIILWFITIFIPFYARGI